MFKMLICMVVIFALCWLPPNVLNVLKDWGLSGSRLFVFLFLLAHVISMSSSMWNPLLYAFLNDNFRREFMAVLPCFKATQQRVRRAYSFSRVSFPRHVFRNVTITFHKLNAKKPGFAFRDQSRLPMCIILHFLRFMQDFSNVLASTFKSTNCRKYTNTAR